MDLERIEALLKLLATHDVNEFVYRDADKTLRLRLGPVAAPVTMHAPVAAATPAPAAPAAAPAGPAAPANDGLVVIESPMVGTMYRSPSPGAPTCVEVGSAVQKGKTICIVEAMKLMNEIESEVNGTVVEILVENGQPVQFGQALMKIRPA
jgi:acetyl-CoA carboxylase biotin carboxyl carrier protein